MTEENPINRRQFLKQIGAGVLGFVLGQNAVPNCSSQVGEQTRTFLPLVINSSEKIVTPDLNQRLYKGIKSLRAQGTEIVGDNTGTWGMSYTKPTNIGLDLISTTVVANEALVPKEEAIAHIESVLKTLQSLRKYKGIFPEFIKINGGEISTEVKNGEIGYSSLDSGWLTFALSLVKDNYPGLEVSVLARELINSQDYSIFLDANGLMGAGLRVDADTDTVVAGYGFSYDNRNSEARAVVLPLVGMGKIPETAWSKMYYRWVTKEGLDLAEGWNYSAFVELTGNVFFREALLAPESFGKSHKNYAEASFRVAQRSNYRIFGWAPCMSPEGSYHAYGLDDSAVVTPYAAALLATTEDPESKTNFKKILDLNKDSALLPDVLISSSGVIGNEISLTLDQNLLFLAANKESVREIVQETQWYPEAETRIINFDNSI